MSEFRLPDGFEKWNRAMRGAYMRGVKAAEAGMPESACPYRDNRTLGGQLTWSRAFIRAWEDGWRDAQA